MNLVHAKKIRLCDAVTASAGYPFRGAVDALPNGRVGVVQMRDVGEAGIDWAALAHVKLPSARSAAFLAPGDVIFTTRGTRNFGLVLEEVPVTAVCSPHFFILRVRASTPLHPGFLAWQLNQRPAQEYFQSAATGSYILNLTRAAIENVPLVIPPIEQQLHILAIDQTFRNQRAVLSALIANNDRQMEAIAVNLHLSRT